MTASVDALRPLIGVTASVERMRDGPWDARHAAVTEAYVLSVAGAGGVPLLLPPQPFDDAVVQRVLDAVDGLLLSGGADVDPASYGAVPHPTTSAPRGQRDAWERALLLEAIRRGMPVLAICRGVQLLDVALGGSLVQHVPEATRVDHGNEAGAYAPVQVEVVGGARLPAALGAPGSPFTVSCAHHQAVDRVADALVVAARSTLDGVVEAVELPGDAFVVGVQWHPEQDEVDRGLFAAFTAAARDHVLAGRAVSTV